MRPDARGALPGESAGMEPRPCQIDSALGRATACPRDLCAFWADGACVVTGLRADLTTAPGLPELLLGIRESLGGRQAVGIDHTLLPPGLR